MGENTLAMRRVRIAALLGALALVARAGGLFAALEAALALAILFAAAFAYLYFDDLATDHFVAFFTALLGVPVTAGAARSARRLAGAAREGRNAAAICARARRRSLRALTLHARSAVRARTRALNAGRVRVRPDGVTIEGLTIPNPSIDGVKWEHYAIVDIARLRVSTTSALHTLSLFGMYCVRVGPARVPVWLGTGVREIERMQVSTFWLYVDEKARHARSRTPRPPALRADGCWLRALVARTRRPSLPSSHGPCPPTSSAIFASLIPPPPTHIHTTSRDSPKSGTSRRWSQPVKPRLLCRKAAQGARERSGRRAAARRGAGGSGGSDGRGVGGRLGGRAHADGGRKGRGRCKRRRGRWRRDRRGGAS